MKEGEQLGAFGLERGHVRYGKNVSCSCTAKCHSYSKLERRSVSDNRHGRECNERTIEERAAIQTQRHLPGPGKRCKFTCRTRSAGNDSDYRRTTPRNTKRGHSKRFGEGEREHNCNNQIPSRNRHTFADDEIPVSWKRLPRLGPNDATKRTGCAQGQCTKWKSPFPKILDRIKGLIVWLRSKPKQHDERSYGAAPDHCYSHKSNKHRTSYTPGAAGFAAQGFTENPVHHLNGTQYDFRMGECSFAGIGPYHYGKEIKSDENGPAHAFNVNCCANTFGDPAHERNTEMHRDGWRTQSSAHLQNDCSVGNDCNAPCKHALRQTPSLEGSVSSSQSFRFTPVGFSSCSGSSNVAVNSTADKLAGLTIHCVMLSLMVVIGALVRWTTSALKFLIYLALHQAVYKGSIAPIREDSEEPITQEQLRDATLFDSTGLKIVLIQYRPPPRRKSIEGPSSSHSADTGHAYGSTATTTTTKTNNLATTATTTTTTPSSLRKTARCCSGSQTNKGTTDRGRKGEGGGGDGGEIGRVEGNRGGGEEKERVNGREARRDLTRSISAHSDSSQDFSHIFSTNSN